MLPPAALRQVADHINEVIHAGSQNQRKALIEALVATVKITGPGRIVPVFRIPQPGVPSSRQAAAKATGGKHGTRSEGAGVRALTNLVGRLGLEPRTGGL